MTIDEQITDAVMAGELELAQTLIKRKNVEDIGQEGSAPTKKRGRPKKAVESVSGKKKVRPNKFDPADYPPTPQEIKERAMYAKCGRIPNAPFKKIAVTCKKCRRSYQISPALLDGDTFTCNDCV